MANDVTFERKDYLSAKKRWSRNEDVCGDEITIKDMGQKYLPKVSDEDVSLEAEKRYQKYLFRACFYPIVGRALAIMVGSAFTNKPDFSVPEDLKYLGEDADGSGVGIFQQSRRALSGIMQCGRTCLLVDYPFVPAGQNTKRNLELLKIRPKIINYKADAVHNWGLTTVNGITKLSLVVINDPKEVTGDDGFSSSTVDRRRVLQLINGFYYVTIYEKGVNGWVAGDSYAPTDSSGNMWTEIPFIFSGSENNDPVIDPAPISDMAGVMLGHWRNSADYENSVFFSGQIQPWMSGITEAHIKIMKDEGMVVGSSSLMAVPEGGEFGFAQAQANSMPREAMQDKQSILASLGAKLLEKGGVVKTATQDTNEKEAEHSVLSLAASNLSEAYTKALYWCSKFYGAIGDAEYKINASLKESDIDAQKLAVYRDIVLGGLMPESDFYNLLQRHGKIDPLKTHEQIKEEIDSSESGLNLDDA